MMKRYFLQKASTYTTQSLKYCFTSKKYDGQRAFWDGGISRGVKTAFYNGIGTGLWTNNMKPIYAPDFWLDELPNYPLEGELFYKDWPTTRSIVSRTTNTLDEEWLPVKFYIFDSPPLESVFADGVIDTPFCKLTFRGICTPNIGVPYGTPFTEVYNTLKSMDLGEFSILVEQHDIPEKEDIIKFCEDYVNQGGEGVICRSKVGFWIPERSKDVYKIKPRLDAEAVVVGHDSGPKGQRILKCDFNGSLFSLSCFNQLEQEDFESNFPIGSLVTFKYRYLSKEGVPIEARYWRKFADNVSDII